VRDHRSFPQPFFDAESAGRVLMRIGNRQKAKRGMDRARPPFRMGIAARRLCKQSGRSLVDSQAASAIASGLNRATGLAYGAVSHGKTFPLAANGGNKGGDRVGRHRRTRPAGNRARVGRLFRWHIDPAPQGSGSTRSMNRAVAGKRSPRQSSITL
jgi:hypothetical protein